MASTILQRKGAVDVAVSVVGVEYLIQKEKRAREEGWCDLGVDDVVVVDVHRLVFFC